MHAMQYEITLPADYDMGIIRRRVETRGGALDGFAGLALKAYCVRERGKDGSPVNQYAPFYVWDDPRALTGFLGGPGFRGLSGDFGRPAVRDWHGLARADGPARAARPCVAERSVRQVPEGADVGERVDRAVAELRETAGEPGVHSVALGLDPLRWELVRFVLRERPVPVAAGGDRDAGTVRYEVLYLAEGTAG